MSSVLSICADVRVSSIDQSEFIRLTTILSVRILNLKVQYPLPANLNHVLLAISDPTRRAILQRLAHGPARISDVAAPFSMSLTGFCKHVRVLERAKLIRRTRHGRENTLALTPEPLREVAQWTLRYQPYWTGQLDRLESFFAAKKETTR